ncbi:cytidylate kinase family protein [Candidatus Uhrbacteria bacterium]|nr:cytidylate kinase family protein [Candidatus Uhrbacteria bacterium]
MRFNGILFSGLPGSGKTTTSRQLAEKLGWQVFYVGGLWREEWTKKYPDGEVSFENFIRSITLEEDRAMDRRAHDMLAQGTIIGDMWHGIIGEGLPILRVFITAPLDIRARRGMNTDKKEIAGKTFDEVKALLNEREERQLALAKKLYGTDYDYRDASGYHITLNSELLTVEEKISSVLHFFQKGI